MAEEDGGEEVLLGILIRIWIYFIFGLGVFGKYVIVIKKDVFFYFRIFIVYLGGKIIF